MSVGHSGVEKPRWAPGGTLFTHRHSALVAPPPELPLVPNWALHPASLPVGRGLEFSPVTKLWFRETLSSTQHQNAGSLSLMARTMIRAGQTQQRTGTAPTAPKRQLQRCKQSNVRLMLQCNYSETQDGAQWFTTTELPASSRKRFHEPRRWTYARKM